jgi:hypothetical protein
VPLVIRRVLAPFLTFALFACKLPQQPPPTQAKTEEGKVDPAAMMTDVESKMTTPPSLRILVESHATGFIEADMKTTLTIAKGDKVRLESEGTFMKEPVSIVFVSDGLVMKRKKNGETSDAVASTGVRQQMLTELVRMGLLHDVATLAEGKLPDHLTDVDTWVVAHDATVGDIDPTFEPPARPIHFLVRVSDKETGDCTLHVDKSGRPVQRVQVVHFPEGDMHVKETYAYEAVPGDVDYAKP